MNEDRLTIPEAAERAKLSESTIKRLQREGVLYRLRVRGVRRTFVSAEQLDALLSTPTVSQKLPKGVVRLHPKPESGSFVDQAKAMNGETP